MVLRYITDEPGGKAFFISKLLTIVSLKVYTFSLSKRDLFIYTFTHTTRSYENTAMSEVVSECEYARCAKIKGA